jgi:hypothetical protein
LLCAAKDDDSFGLDGVLAMTRQTLRLAEQRMVGPETLADLGQYLPAAYLHPDTFAGEPEAAS